MMFKKPAGVLMFLLVILKVLGTAETCRCSTSSSPFFPPSFYCSCVSLNLTSVPQNLSTNITSLNLEGNHITTLSQSDFSQYRSLDNLDLRQNRISIINPGAFYHLSNLTKLSLMFNGLTSLRSGMFTGLGKLETLFIYSNNISDIQDGTFSATPQLDVVYLSGNKLRTLRAGMFTGLGNLTGLFLGGNDITSVQTGTFNTTPQLRSLYLNSNKLKTLTPDMFTGLGNLETLYLYGSDIGDIQAGTFNLISQLKNLDLEHNHIQSIPSNSLSNLLQLTSLKLSYNNITAFPFEELSNIQTISTLHLDNNLLTTLTSTAYDVLSSLSDVSLDNNPWQCDCRMVDFKLKLTESTRRMVHLNKIIDSSTPFENQITCSQPDHLSGLNLKDIKLENLFSGCFEPKIVRFERSDSMELAQGEDLLAQLVCEASGIPTPTITIIPPSGLNATVESGVIFEDGNVTLRNVTAADAGLYVCIASNPVGSTFAIFSTEVVKPVSSPRFTLPVFVGSVSGAVAGTVVLGAIVLTIWRRTCAKSSSVALDTGVALTTQL
ncbi:PREDICTED: SLIT and NTRK-like protein 2 [Branchiostoma belcheri]|uniref:SLIT and NTRK-like protein 2 n=1 Tax=Branchiostoma belcheri TaxID=7741 RepID=A0A6P4YGK9_BRABE|nr:PREDICTED: SLIT and NTRK-like protein 2 [Branchiostoma belcheri]